MKPQGFYIPGFILNELRKAQRAWRLLEGDNRRYASLNTHPPDLREISHTKTNLSDTILEETGHPILKGLFPQFLH